MPYEADFNPMKFIHENRDKALELFAKTKEEFEKQPKSRQKPCIFFVVAAAKPRNPKRGVPHGGAELEIRYMNVGNGLNNKNTVKNLMRTGKLPIGYWFPNDEEIKSLRASLTSSGKSTFSNSESQYLMEEDPFREIRAAVEEQVNLLLGGWENDKELSSIKSQNEAYVDKIKELEAQVAAASQKKSAKPDKDESKNN